MNEATTQSLVRLALAAAGGRMWRNNTGVLRNQKRRPVRFGLANDSAALNARLKSSDLIGWEPVVITGDMVGQTIARFTSIECKHPGWHLTPGDARGQAQRAWIDLVRADGGRADFVTDVVDGRVITA